MPKHSQQLFDLIESSNVEALDKFLEEQKKEIGLDQLTALINQADNKGDTALHKAAKKNVSMILYALIFKDTDISITNKQGDTAFHITVEMGNITALKYLINRDKGNKILNLPNNKGETPLQKAINSKKLEVIIYLLRFLPFLNIEKSREELKQAIKIGLINEQDVPIIISTCEEAVTRLKKIPYQDKQDKIHIKNLDHLIDELKKPSKNPASSGFSFSKLFSPNMSKTTVSENPASNTIVTGVKTPSP